MSKGFSTKGIFSWNSLAWIGFGIYIFYGICLLIKYAHTPDFLHNRGAIERFCLVLVCMGLMTLVLEIPLKVRGFLRGGKDFSKKP